jgi:dienelactone hydrolase
MAWSVGFGPDLHAWLVHPADADPRTLPGVLALHSHAGIKSIGAKRLLAVPEAAAYQAAYEGGIAFANHVASRGVTVLAPDAFSWGSRRFDLSGPTGQLGDLARLLDGAGVTGADRYDELAKLHEHLVAKRAGAMGTSYAGMIAHDDLTSLEVLRSLVRGPIGIAGFSGGGGRALTLSALQPVDKVAIVAMMATYESLIPDYLDGHSWLLHTPGVGRVLDLPELAAGRRTHALQVAYCEQDDLFSLTGMEAADEALTRLFSGAAGSYRGIFVPTPHAVTEEIHDLVTDFLTA